MLCYIKNYKDLPGLGALPPDPQWCPAAGGSTPNPANPPPFRNPGYATDGHHQFNTYTPFQRSFSILAIALFIYYTSVPAGTEVK